MRPENALKIPGHEYNQAKRKMSVNGTWVIELFQVIELKENQKFEI